MQAKQFWDFLRAMCHNNVTTPFATGNNCDPNGIFHKKWPLPIKCVFECICAPTLWHPVVDHWAILALKIGKCSTSFGATGKGVEIYFLKELSQNEFKTFAKVRDAFRGNSCGCTVVLLLLLFVFYFMPLGLRGCFYCINDMLLLLPLVFFNQKL